MSINTPRVRKYGKGRKKEEGRRKKDVFGIFSPLFERYGHGVRREYCCNHPQEQLRTLLVQLAGPPIGPARTYVRVLVAQLERPAIGRPDGVRQNSSKFPEEWIGEVEDCIN